MDRVPLEEQAAVLKAIAGWQLRRMSPQQTKALQAAERTLSGMAGLRQRFENADHDDESQSDQMSEELIHLLGLPRAEAVVKA